MRLFSGPMPQAFTFCRVAAKPFGHARQGDVSETWEHGTVALCEEMTTTLKKIARITPPSQSLPTQSQPSGLQKRLPQPLPLNRNATKDLFPWRTFFLYRQADACRSPILSLMTVWSPGVCPDTPKP